MPDRNSYWLKRCIIANHNRHYSFVQLSALSLILCFLSVVCMCMYASFPLVSVYICQVYICMKHWGCWPVIKVYKTKSMLSVAMCSLLRGMFPFHFYVLHFRKPHLACLVLNMHPAVELRQGYKH